MQIVNKTLPPGDRQDDADKLDGQIEAPVQTKTDDVLPPKEGLKRFNELNRLVLTGMAHALTGSIALHEIEQSQLYRFAGFKTIAEYGLKILKQAQSTVYQHVHVGRVAMLLGDSTVCRTRPVNAAQIRPLLNLDDDDQVIKIWNTAATLYGEGGLTEKAVARAKRSILKQESPKTPAFTATQIAEKMRKALRSCWDSCAVDERPALLGEVFLFSKELSKELDKKDISPELAAMFSRVNSKLEADEDAEMVVEPAPDAKPRPDAERIAAVPACSKAKSQIETDVPPRRTPLKFGLGLTC